MSNLDDRITKEIKEALDKEMSESAMDINVDCRDSFVTLSGFVDTLAEKRAAEEITTCIKDIQGIRNQITISTDGTITDKEIEMEVMNKLNNSHFRDDITGVSARVSDGVAVLIGSVETLRDKKRAINEAEKALGVKDVTANIDIASYREVDDASIENALTRELSATEISVPDVFSKVNDGVVKLGGHVNNRREMELAVEIAEGIEGVKKVDNKLRLR